MGMPPRATSKLAAYGTGLPAVAVPAPGMLATLHRGSAGGGSTSGRQPWRAANSTAAVALRGRRTRRRAVSPRVAQAQVAAAVLSPAEFQRIGLHGRLRHGAGCPAHEAFAVAVHVIGFALGSDAPRDAAGGACHRRLAAAHGHHWPHHAAPAGGLRQPRGERQVDARRFARRPRLRLRLCHVGGHRGGVALGAWRPGDAREPSRRGRGNARAAAEGRAASRSVQCELHGPLAVACCAAVHPPRAARSASRHDTRGQGREARGRVSHGHAIRRAVPLRM